jgi:hypothetical protein
MRAHTVQLFSIEELSEEAQEKAIDKLRELDYFGIDSREIEEDFKQTLEERGLPTDNIEFSLGYSQGDGVAFYGDIDVEKILKDIGEWDEWEVFVKKHGFTATSTRNSWGSHYSHWNTMDVELTEDREFIGAYSESRADRLCELIKLRVQSTSKELEKRGYEMIEANQEKDYIIECCEANEMEFREDGRLWHG